MDIAIVGAGLSGLVAAHELILTGHNVRIFEKGDLPGGRVQSDLVDGCILDRGFQVFLTAYPAAQSVLDYDALDLRPLMPGASVRLDNSFHRVSDPFREPQKLWDTWRAPVGSLGDKVRTLKFRRDVSKGSIDALWERPETTAMQRLKALGFSDKMISRFFEPFFTGITLDPTLSGSSRMIDFVFRMLSVGEAAVPARGMGQISEQLAAKLPPEAVLCNQQVDAVTATSVTVAGEQLGTDAVIVATDRSNAAKLCPSVTDQGWHSVTSVWFQAESAPEMDPILVLNGDASTGPINNLAVMSRVSPFYGSDGKATVVVSAPAVRAGLVADMQTQLVEWYGKKARRWEVMRVDEVPQAQPAIALGSHRSGAVKLGSDADDGNTSSADAGVWLCGDHTLDSSINGAIRSGQLVAQAVMRDGDSEATALNESST